VQSAIGPLVVGIDELCKRNSRTRFRTKNKKLKYILVLTFFSDIFSEIISVHTTPYGKLSSILSCDKIFSDIHERRG